MFHGERHLSLLLHHSVYEHSFRQMTMIMELGSHQFGWLMEFIDHLILIMVGLTMTDHDHKVGKREIYIIRSDRQSIIEPL